MSNELLRYVGRRLFQLAMVIFLAVSVNFMIPRLLPGDPVATALARLQTAGGGQSIDIKNSDPTLHNIKAVPTANRGFNISQGR